jgi:peptidoglycan/xylan/chitin deacetylase (PgdA/CDA1 family)
MLSTLAEFVPSSRPSTRATRTTRTWGRATLASALDRARFPQLALSMRRVRSLWLTVLTYHHLASPDDVLPLDEGVKDADAEGLDRQLAFVRRYFDAIGIDELRSFAAGTGTLPPNPLLVTFDDGYRDNHDVVLPILLRNGLRATFFIATDYVERRRLYWWDRLSWMLRRARCEVLRLEYPYREAIPLGDLEARRHAARRVQRIVKDHVGLDLRRFLDGVERASGATLSAADERRFADAVVMTWTHVRNLRAAGMDVQSHTASHRVLQTLAPHDLERELVTSRAVLEDVLGEPVRAISYPVGRSVRDDPQVLRAVRAAGYELGFSNATGVSWTSAFDPFDVKRLAMERSMPDSFFRSMLALPFLAYAR